METQEKADYEKFKAKKPQEIDRPFFFDVKKNKIEMPPFRQSLLNVLFCRIRKRKNILPTLPTAKRTKYPGRKRREV